EKITIDKSGANTAAVRGLLADSGGIIELRQSKYLNNLVEQDHRAIKRRLRPMMGLKSFHSAARLIAGIETMHMIKKGQLRCPGGLAFSHADHFYTLPVRCPGQLPELFRLDWLIATEPQAASTRLKKRFAAILSRRFCSRISS